MSKLTIWFEIGGGFLVLIAGAWDVVAVGPLAEVGRHAYQYRLEKKLDSLWFQVAAIRVRVDPSLEETRDTEAPAAAQERWRFAEDQKELAKLNAQTAGIGYARAACFLLGSGLLLLGRYRELIGRSSAGDHIPRSSGDG